jgi:hypothetical protein
MFFRELEINKKLESRVLDLETQKQLSDLMLSVSREIAQSSKAVPTAFSASKESPIIRKSSSGVSIKTRIDDVQLDCNEGTCTVSVGLMNNSAGTTQGEILLVLEAEIPRIGTANTAQPVRKRFFFYPNGEPQDDLDPEQIPTLPRKSFRLINFLRVTAPFKMNKLLRPLSLNAYLYDSQNNLIQHERKALEND